MGALAKKKIRLKEHLFFAVMLTRLKLSKYCAEVTATTGMLLICEVILGPFRKLRSFRKWYKGMDNNPDDETSCTTQYQEAFLKYVENEYCAKHRRVPSNTHESSTSCTLIHSGTASISCQSPFDPYDLSRYDEQYLIPNNVAETTPRQSNGTAHRSTAARLYLNSPPEAPKTSGHIDPNLNDYHSDPIEISSTFWLPDITGWWRQQEKTSSKYAHLPNVACDIFPIIPDGIAVEANFSLGRDEIGWRQSKTTRETLCQKVIVTRFARANNAILAGADPELDAKNTDNDMEMKKEAKERTMHRMAKVHDFVEMWQGSQNLHATQEGISPTQQADDCRGIHCGHRRDRHSIVVTLSTWWCRSISIVRKICFTTTIVCKEPPWRPNWNMKCPPNPKNTPSSSPMWWG